MDFTAEEVKEAMISKNITHVDHHECSLCGYMTQFVRKGKHIFFDSGCDCVGSSDPNLNPKDWNDVAEWINMQSNKSSKSKLAAEFGL